ncbi:nitrile hydratase accessory protein [Bradyrhizobium sp. Arg62]|uniref:nitrile hydratase accessory protein n=1 Tax=Bradyrhizobium TaxID=374 RepID=UPI001E63E8D2|nr:MULTISPECIES: nitrile hydratase accessory protein [Bradyrhizobium]MCC8939704.1 nitrile hydratase accessory protein [Bradyrhizobium ivorense]MCC8949537.1 nitrile hydratase accessory protein [Bradyrhizobium brasilense]
MQTNFEHFALASMLGKPDRPPKDNGSLCFGAPWERQAFGMALALSKQGVFEWDDFRSAMISSIAASEATHDKTDPSWDYYEIWLTVLEQMVQRSGLIDQSGQASA